MAKMTQNDPKLLKNSPKWSEMFRQMVQMRQGILTPNLPDLKWWKIAQHGQKWPNMTKNGPKWSEMFRQMVQMRQGIPAPNSMT